MRLVLTTLLMTTLIDQALGQCAPQVLFTNYTALSSGTVPGVSPIVRFAAGSSPANAFQQIMVSPDGAYWALRGAAGTSSGQIVMRGLRRSRAGAQLIVRRTVTPVLGTRTCDTIGEHVDVNNAGVVAFTGDLSGSLADDSFSATWNGNFTFVAREGQPVPGLLYGYGVVNNGPTLLSNGRVVHVSELLTGSANLGAIVSLANTNSGDVLTLTGTSVPLGQRVSPVQPLAALTPIRVACSDDGTERLFGATLAGPVATNAVIVHNDTVLAQRGFAIAGSGLTSAYARVSAGIAPLQCAPTGGSCIARVTLIDNVDAIVHVQAGAVTGTLAHTGGAIIPGASEFYADAQQADTFLSAAVASSGDWVVVGATDEQDALRDTVLVYNGRTVLLREGDPFDLNEDGLLNDNAFVGGFGPEGLAISDTGDVYVTVSVRGSAGNVTGAALLTLQTPRCSDIDFNNDGVFPSDDDIVDFLNVVAGADCPACDTIDFNNDCVFPSDDDIVAFFNVLAGGSCTP